jgi:TolB-like protein/Tfp pilus assembly protein PilF
LLLFGRHARPTASAAGARSVAVLPLAHSGDPQLDFLVDGLTEDLITRLSRVPHLKVIARDTAYRYQGKSIDPQQVGRELGVDAVLTGRVTHNDRTVSVSAELIDAHDRSRLWGRTFDRSIDDVQSMQRELAAQIASGLRLRLSGDDHARFNQIYTRNADAYQLYLKGRYFWNKRTGRGLQTAVGYFTQAVAKDPSFALAYSGLADSYGLLTEYHTAPARETYSPAKSAAMKALELDDNLAEAHSSLAYVRQFYEWDWAAAENEFKQAIELNPNYATGHQWYAELLSAAGRHNEALAEIRKAQELDPLSLIVNAVEANILYMARRYDDAIEKSSRVIEMDSNFPEAYEYLKRAFDQKGRYADAIAARQARRRILGKDVSETPALRAAAAATTPAEYWKKRIEQELIEARTEGLQPFEFAELLAQAGDHPRALEYLERACTGHDFMMVYIRVAPNLEPIRSDPRYHEILRRSCRM